MYQSESNNDLELSPTDSKQKMLQYIIERLSSIGFVKRIPKKITPPTKGTVDGRNPAPAGML